MCKNKLKIKEIFAIRVSGGFFSANYWEEKNIEYRKMGRPSKAQVSIFYIHLITFQLCIEFCSCIIMIYSFEGTYQINRLFGKKCN